MTRLEEQIKTGAFTVKQVAAAPAQEEPDEERPPLPDDADAPPSDDQMPTPTTPKQEAQAPAGFWTELMTASRKELKPPASGFFVAAQNSPLRGALKGDVLEIRCQNTFVAEAVNRNDILEVVARKSAALLGRPVRVQVVDMSAKLTGNPKMQQLLNFGRAHSDIVNIKE